MPEIPRVRDQQIGLARELLPRNVVDPIVASLLTGQIDRVFHTEQLLLTARVAPKRALRAGAL
jgi:hypothetical protein